MNSTTPKKVLIISYYWPPSGGAGVQRWLKLSKYLQEMGIEVQVLTVDEKVASYTHLDTSLVKDVHPDIKIHTTNSFEINNIYGRLVGKKNIPTAGFSNVDNSSFLQKIVNAIRSNFFIPDPRVGWKRYAVKAAKQILKDEAIDTIITTSPPHSVQMIGRELKRKLNINWIVDLRDPWTDIYYYSLLGHTKFSKKIDKTYERTVLEEADHIVTVSYGFRELFLTKSERLTKNKFSVVYNGYDKSDFLKKAVIEKNEKFTISYIGTMSDQYDPSIIFKALLELNRQHPNKIILKFIGSVSNNIRKELTESALDVEFIGHVPHAEVSYYQQTADLLLLLVPEAPNNKGIVPGKVFEYLASGSRILGLGPTDGDISKILKECNAGAIFSRKEEGGILNFISEAFGMYNSGEKNELNTAEVEKYSRIAQARTIYKLIQST